MFLLADELLAWIPAVLGGRIFTHRLSAQEATHDVIAWHPDLAPLSMLTDCDAFQRLADGAPVSEVFVELGEDFGDRGVTLLTADARLSRAPGLRCRIDLVR